MKVFQTNNKELTELKELYGNKSDDNEKLLQTMIENNLSTIFPNLEFLTTEYRISNLRPDSIAFDNDRNSFVIIEYKNVKHKGVVDQGMSYYELLQEKKGDFVLLYHKIKGKVLDAENGVNWDETRVIFISREFTEHQRRASKSVELPIELYEFSKYDGVFLLNKIENKKETYADKKKPTTQIRIQEYSEEDYLNGEYGGVNVTDQLKSTYHELKIAIIDKFPEIESKPRKRYVGFYSDGSPICTIDAQKDRLRLFYSVKQKGVISDGPFVEDYSKKGHWGIGDYMSPIRDRADIEKAMPLIETVYRFKTS